MCAAFVCCGQDLIALSEADNQLRSVQLCYCLLEISPSERHSWRFRAGLVDRRLKKKSAQGQVLAGATRNCSRRPERESYRPILWVIVAFPCQVRALDFVILRVLPSSSNICENVPETFCSRLYTSIYYLVNKQEWSFSFVEKGDFQYPWLLSRW